MWELVCFCFYAPSFPPANLRNTNFLKEKCSLKRLCKYWAKTFPELCSGSKTSRPLGPSSVVQPASSSGRGRRRSRTFPASRRSRCCQWKCKSPSGARQWGAVLSAAPIRSPCCPSLVRSMLLRYKLSEVVCRGGRGENDFKHNIFTTAKTLRITWPL